MGRFQFRVGELALGVAFAGVYAGLVATTSGTPLWAMAAAAGGIVLPMAYLVALLMLRQHRGGRAGASDGGAALGEADRS